jgi:hypothetical protein
MHESAVVLDPEARPGQAQELTEPQTGCDRQEIERGTIPAVEPTPRGPGRGRLEQAIDLGIGQAASDMPPVVALASGMIPIVEMADAPVYLPRYLCWHERTTGRAPAERKERQRMIEAILARPSARGR